MTGMGIVIGGGGMGGFGGHRGGGDGGNYGRQGPLTPGPDSSSLVNHCIRSRFCSIAHVAIVMAMSSRRDPRMQAARASSVRLGSPA